MDLQQLFDPESSTYTYILADQATREAVIIDPVLGQRERDLAILREHGLKLSWVLDTHVHADHMTGANALKAATGALTAVGRACEACGYDRNLENRDVIDFGAERIRALATPGHTAGGMSYLWRDRVFTGDTLLIGGCGRTDFQNGDAGTLFDSITETLFRLPEATRVHPGHDYHGRRESSIAAERGSNPRVSGRTREQFIEAMGQLDLAPPPRIATVVPANRIGGLVDAADTPWRSMSPRAALATMELGDLMLDLRDAGDTAQTRVAHAVPIAHENLEAMRSLAAAHGALYLICRTGRRSLAATRALAAAGVGNVVNVSGGMSAWQAAGLPVESGDKVCA